MLKRFELHNHTTESDASITCRQLLEHMEKDGADVFAITDHNTISGHRILRDILKNESHDISCIYGMEYTTYYGHILCLNLHEYVPWDNIDQTHPEKLFAACKAAGALTGVAHPFSYGAPYARGCRFDMTISDFTDVDFIEVFNDLEPLHEVNGKGLAWWEDLVLHGEHLAATCGMDLHGPWDMSMQFATYLEGSQDGNAEEELTEAIKTRKTWVSKGMVLVCRQDGEMLRCTLQDVHKKGFQPASRYCMTLKGLSGIQTYAFDGESLEIPLTALAGDPIWIPKLYRDTPVLEELICIAPPLYLTT